MIIHQNFINTPSHHYPMYVTPITNFNWWRDEIPLEILTVFWSFIGCVTRPITVSIEKYIEKMRGNILNTILHWLYIICTGHCTDRYLSTSVRVIVWRFVWHKMCEKWQNLKLYPPLSNTTDTKHSWFFHLAIIINHKNNWCQS